jgi:D-alanyl-D-alanine carboxypeptidase
LNYWPDRKEPGHPPSPRSFHNQENIMTARTLSRSVTTRTTAGIAGIALLGALLSSCAAPSTSTSDTNDTTSTATATAITQLSALAQESADAGGLGTIVRINQKNDDAIEITGQAGWTEADHDLSVDDQFRVGSNTKTITATLVLQEVAENNISLDDTVEAWIPSVVPNGANITIRQLLNHTSGLGDFILTPEFMPSLAGQEERSWSPEQLLAITPQQDPGAAPGSTFYYSNANYAAAGLVLEEITGTSFVDLIEERITDPLDMSDSYLATSAQWEQDDEHARGYEPAPAELAAILAPVVELPVGFGFAGEVRAENHIDTSAIDPSYTWAAGAMVSTAEDWDKFLTALNSGELLPAEQMEDMRTVVPDGVSGAYGLGIMKIDSACGTVWGHTGGLPGYSSEIYTDQNGQRSVTVLTTTNFGVKTPEATEANQALITASICAMYDKPVPSENDQ